MAPPHWCSFHYNLLSSCMATADYGSYYVPGTSIFPQRRASWV